MSIYTSVLQGGTNNHQTTSEEANYIATDFVPEGVVGVPANTSGVSPATGPLAVNAQDTPNMTVAVSSGVGYVQATPTGGSSQMLRVNNNASANVTISANSSGSTKYDWVYIKVDPDKAKDPNSSADDVATLVTSRSTSATADDGTPPTYGYPLAVVTVANSASSITNGNIADKRVATGATPATNLYKFSAYRSTTQNVGTAATKVNFDVEFYDNNSNYDNATNFRYTAPVDGTYRFSANVSTTTAGTGTSVLIMFYVNGSESRRGPRNEASAGQAPGVSFSTDIPLTAGDYVEVFVSTGTAAKALDVGGHGYNTFSGYLLS